MSVLRFENVSKQSPGGHAALDSVSFEVAQGEMLFVTGHSGAGKSTLLKLIHLSERPTRGAVVFGGRNLLKVRGRRGVPGPSPANRPHGRGKRVAAADPARRAPRRHPQARARGAGAAGPGP